jgi:hypothetical protein
MLDWQTVAVALVLAWAVAYLVRAALRTRKGCGGGCGCAKSPARPANEQSVWVASEKLTLRRRDPQP